MPDFPPAAVAAHVPTHERGGADAIGTFTLEPEVTGIRRSLLLYNFKYDNILDWTSISDGAGARAWSDTYGGRQDLTAEAVANSREGLQSQARYYCVIPTVNFFLTMLVTRTAVTQCRHYFGLWDTAPTQAEPPIQGECAYFRLVCAGAEGNLECVTQNGGIEEVTDTGAVMGGSLYHRTIHIDGDAATVRFYRNVTLLATHSVRVPSAHCYIGVLAQSREAAIKEIVIYRAMIQGRLSTEAP